MPEPEPVNMELELDKKADDLPAPEPVITEIKENIPIEYRNILSRSKTYPFTSKERFEVPDIMVNWKVFYSIFTNIVL